MARVGERGHTSVDGQATTVEIEKVVYRGKGLARIGGKVVFVPAVLPGERVRVRVTRDRGNSCDAVPDELLVSSAHRVEPACPLAQCCAGGAVFCPGCAYQHVDYAEEVRLKQAQLVNMLEHQAGIASPSCAAPVASPAHLGYRNKIVLHAWHAPGPCLGYFSDDNTTVVDVPRCALARPEINDTLRAVRADAAAMASLRTHMKVTFRHTRHDGCVWWRGAADATAPALTERTVLGDMHVPRGSFFQVNPAVADALLEAVRDILAGSRAARVIDLYCGVGVFAAAASAAGIPVVHGIDSDAAAVRAAARNARERSVACTFAAAPVAVALRGALRGTQAGDTAVIVDPPRRGLEPRVLQELLRTKPGLIIYISCAPDTLARDLRVCAGNGYTVRQAQLFDMFPRTPYFETVTVLSPVA